MDRREEFAEKLKEMIDRHGAELYCNGDKLKAYAMDYMPDFRAERNLLLSVIKLGVHDKLRNSRDIDLMYVKSVSEVRDELFLEENMAKYIVATVAYSLNILDKNTWLAKTYNTHKNSDNKHKNYIPTDNTLERPKSVSPNGSVTNNTSESNLSKFYFPQCKTCNMFKKNDCSMYNNPLEKCKFSDKSTGNRKSSANKSNTNKINICKITNLQCTMYKNNKCVMYENPQENCYRIGKSKDHNNDLKKNNSTPPAVCTITNLNCPSFKNGKCEMYADPASNCHYIVNQKDYATKEKKSNDGFGAGVVGGIAGAVLGGPIGAAVGFGLGCFFGGKNKK